MRDVGLAMTVAVSLAPAALAGQSGAEDLQGAWRVVEVVASGPAGQQTEPPQPGLLLFAGSHYSYTLITRPRPGVPRGPVSAEQVLAAWNPFTANAGTFEISEDTMIRRPVVAKSPNAMGPGIYNEYRFRLSADTLWITSVGTETGPEGSPTTVRYERAR